MYVPSMVALALVIACDVWYMFRKTDVAEKFVIDLTAVKLMKLIDSAEAGYRFIQGWSVTFKFDGKWRRTGPLR